MMSSSRTLIFITALSGASCVMLGAFGAHGLKPLLADWALKVYHTGVEYQFYHTFALLFLGLFNHQEHKVSLRLLSVSASSFLLGIFFFCGSLYALALSEWLFGSKLSWLGAITPIGGTFFIIGWLSLAIAAFKTDALFNNANT